MFGHRPAADAFRFFKAAVGNAVAAAAPAAYMRWTGETGRGRATESPAAAARYFRDTADDLVREFAARRGGRGLDGVSIIEYGPGDVLALALLCISRGAERVLCVDRFPLVRSDRRRTEILRSLLETMPESERRKALEAFTDPRDPSSPFRPDRIAYEIRTDGCSGKCAAFDLAHSRAVLEHASRLDKLFADMRRALKPGGLSLHLVDLKSHGLHRESPLDFLTWPDRAWKLMYGARGAPNRLRVDAYRRAACEAGLKSVTTTVIDRAAAADISAVRPHLSEAFRDLLDEDLSVLGFWLAAET